MTSPADQPQSERDLSALVTAVFTNWRNAGVEFLVLRNYESLPRDTNHDIDVLVLPKQLDLAERILVQTANVAGYEQHTRVEFSPVSIFFYDPKTLHQIQFDLFPQVKWRGLPLLSPAQLIARKADRGLYCIPHPAHEAVSNLVTRLVYQGYVKEKYKPSILAGFSQDCEEATRQLAIAFGQQLADRLATAVIAERWADIEPLHGALRRSLFWRTISRHPLQTLGSWFGDLGRFAGRLLHLPGLTVVLIGPDGCGKSSAATQLANAMSPSFPSDKLLRIHWKPAVFLRKRRALRPPSVHPHGAPPRGKAASVAALIYHWVEFMAGWFLQMWPVLFRNGFILIDRYHYDFLVDPRRYRLDPPAGLVKVLFRLVPQPDLVFLLDAPTAVLQSRKKEVAAQETERQRNAYRVLTARLACARTVDASQPIESVAADMTRHVLERLAAKHKRHRGRKWE